LKIEKIREILGCFLKVAFHFGEYYTAYVWKKILILGEIYFNKGEIYFNKGEIYFNKGKIYFNTYINFAATCRKFILSFSGCFSLLIGFKRYGYLEYFGNSFFCKLKLLIIHRTLISWIIQIFVD